jgi:xenotropic and polytropic retrovirus receptor 1
MSSSARLRRILSSGPEYHRRGSDSIKYGYDLQAYDTVRQRERELWDFMDSELDKVETFYRQKEEQAGARLAILREQLHEMRNRRIEELAEAKRRIEQPDQDSSDDANGKADDQMANPLQWMEPIKSKIFKPGPNSKAFLQMPVTPVSRAEDGRDYTRRPHEVAVPYKSAKRKLKLALQEFYRGLELLKSYALLNRTAFRKLNKKYDKAVNARPPYRYMNEKVNKAWFVNSDVIDGHIHVIEDLYARYFEKGNRKVAMGKLRRLTRRPSDKSGNTFVNGLFLGIGAVFAFQGLAYGIELLYGPDATIKLQTSYLLQIYGGYFLMLTLFGYFCVDCYIWTINKINYPFIFEFDTRNNLDWRQLAMFPSFCFFLFGILMWLNFTRYGTSAMFLYYPVVLIGLTLLLILFPAPILCHKSRGWFAYSHVSHKHRMGHARAPTTD